MDKRVIQVNAKGEGKAEIAIIGDIGESFFSEGVTINSVRNELKGLGEVREIEVVVASLGGSADEGLGIHDILKMHPARVTSKIIGATASAGTLAALGADEATISENALFLGHKAWMVAGGNADDLREQANNLDKFDSRIANIYKQRIMRNGKLRSIEEILDFMAKDEWITPEEALDFGFVDSVFKPEKAAAYAAHMDRVNQMITRNNLPIINQSIMKDESQEATLVDKIINGVKGLIKNEEAAPIADTVEETAPEATEETAEATTENEWNEEEVVEKVSNAFAGQLNALQAEIKALKSEKAKNSATKVTTEAKDDNAIEAIEDVEKLSLFSNAIINRIRKDFAV